MSDLVIEYRNPADLKGYSRNTRMHSLEQVAAIRRSIDAFGFTNPILLKDDGVTIGAGHARNAAALLPTPLQRVPTIRLPGLTDEQWRAYVIADNRLAELGSTWDVDMLRIELGELQVSGLDISLTGFDLDLSGLGGVANPQGTPQTGGSGSLAERFGIPPFSVLNAREGWWQDRKRAWISLGIKSELGRGEGATYDAEEITEPGLNHYRNRRPLTFNDGAAIGAGGLSAQAAAKINDRKKAKANGKTAAKTRRKSVRSGSGKGRARRGRTARGVGQPEGKPDVRD